MGSPPPVDAYVGRACKPGVEDVDAADGVGPQQRLLEGRVVVEPQALPEPVDRIHDHHSNGWKPQEWKWPLTDLLNLALSTLTQIQAQ